MINNIMLDLETMGTGLFPPIIQLAAVRFDTGDEFNAYCSLNANEAIGYKACQETADWWVKQSDHAKQVLVKSEASKKSLGEILTEFNRWVSQFNNPYIWGNGSLFDNRIILQAMQDHGIKPSWSFRNDMDMRTAIFLAKSKGFDPKSIPFDGVRHNAIDDCKHQIKVLRAAAKHIGVEL